MPHLPIQAMLSVMNTAHPEDPHAGSSTLMILLLAIMHWPKEPQGRVDFLKQNHFANLELLDALPASKEHPSIDQLMRLQKEALGGWRSLAAAPPQEQVIAKFNRNGIKGEWVGASLCFAYWLQRNHARSIGDGVSLRKVWSLLFRTGDQYFEHPPAMEALRDSWEEYKPVAHLWAAKFFMDRWIQDPFPGSPWEFGAHIKPGDISPLVSQAMDLHGKAPEWIKRVLVMAQTFQEFGLTFRPKHSRKPLLDADDLWMVDDLPLWEIEHPNLVFRDEALEMLADA